MKFLKIYDDIPTVYTKHNLPQRFKEALGEEWIVEFYSLKGGRMHMMYPTDTDTDGLDNFDIKNDQVFIFWNLIWSYHEDLNMEQGESYLRLIEKGAKIKITTYSGYASIEDQINGVERFTNLFGREIVSEYCETPMYSDSFLNSYVPRMANVIKNAFK